MISLCWWHRLIANKISLEKVNIKKNKQKKVVLSDPDARESKETRSLLTIQVYEYCKHTFEFLLAFCVHIASSSLNEINVSGTHVAIHDLWPPTSSHTRSDLLALDFRTESNYCNATMVYIYMTHDNYYSDIFAIAY